MPALRPNGLRVKGSDGGTATTTIVAPDGLQRGDFLLLIGGSDTDTAQAGFVGPVDVDGFTPVTPWGGTLGGANLKVWSRWATGADVGKTYTITVPTGSAQVLYLAAFSGVDPTNPIAVAPVNGDGGSTAANAAVAPAITSPVAGALALFAWFAKGGDTTQAFTVPAGTTGVASSNSTGTGYLKGALGSETIGTTATGTRTATLSGTARRWSAVSLALRPATTVTAPTGTDALQRRELGLLRAWESWLSSAGAKGHVGEFGVVTLYPSSTGVPQWQALLEAYLTELDAAGLGGTGWASGREWGNGYPLGVHVGTAVGDPLTIANTISSNFAAHPNRGIELHGVNLSGWEKGASINGGDTSVRTLSAGYVHTAADFTFLAGQGVRTVRLPCAWERLQPTRGAALDTTALSTLDGMLTSARAAGIGVILDPLHNYGRYTLASSAVDVLGGAITNAQLSDFWTRLSTWVRAVTTRDLAVVAYDVMNEPHDLPGGAATWQSASQAAVTALRNAGDARPLLIEGYAYSSIVSWATNHPTGWITDPAGNFFYSPHHYFDTQSALGSRSGTYQQSATGPILTYSQELASAQAGENVPPRTYALGQAVETDSVSSIKRIRTHPLGQAGEYDAVRAINRLPGEVRKAVETDQAFPIDRIRTRSVGEPTEQDRALAIRRLRLRRLGQAGETDSVRPIKRLRLTRVGQAVEYDVMRQLEESATAVSDEAYDLAIRSRYRRPYGTLRVDWTNAGTFPAAVTDPGYLDDVVDEIEIERALDGDLPEGAGQIDGFATATLKAALGGKRRGATMPFAAELSPFRPDSPLYAVKHRTLANLAAELGVLTEQGPRAERLFTGPVHDLDMSEGESSVQLEGVDRSERLRALVTLPTYGEFVTHANRRPWKLTVNSQAVIDLCLRRNGIYASPPARSAAIISCTGHGGLFAERGFNGAPISIYGSGPTSGVWTEGAHPYGMLGTPESPNNGTVGYQEFYGITDGVNPPVRFEAGSGVGVSCLLHVGSYMTGSSSVENRLLQIRPTENEYPRLFVNVFANGDLYAGLSTSASSIVSTPRIPTGAGAWRFFGVHFQWTNATTLVVRVRMDGQLRTYTLTTPAVVVTPTDFFAGYRPALQLNGQMARSWTNLQLWPSFAPPTTTTAAGPWQGEQHVSQADVGRGNNELVYLPDVSSADSWEVLKAVVQAEYGVHGFTEYGRYFFRPRTDVRPDRVDHVLKIDDNLADVGYGLSSDTLRNSVGITTSRAYHSGALDTVVKADDVEQFVVPAGTTKVYEIDWPHGAAGYQGGVLPYYPQKDSVPTNGVGFPADAVRWSSDIVHGWTYSSIGASGGYTINDNTRRVVVRYCQIDARRVQIRISNPGPGPIRLATSAPADASSEGEPAMRIGGWPLEKAVDRVTTYRNEASIAELGGQDGGGERSLPVASSEWRQDEDALSPVAWALLDVLADERPVLEDLPVRGDPRIRVGNVAECHFRDLSVPVTGIVVKTRHRLSKETGRLETDVSVRPLPVTQLAPDGWSFYVDVSHYQAESSTPLDLARLKVLGYAGVVAKIGQGAGTKANGDTLGAIVDPAWEKWRDEGLVLWPRATAGYWYVGNTEPPADQAARCLAAIGDTSVPVMLDCEDGSGNFANVLAVLDAFRAAGLLVTMIYAGRNYATTNFAAGSSLAGRGVSLISARYWTNDPAGVDPRADFDDQLRARPTGAKFGFEPFLGVTPAANQFTQYGRVYAGQMIDVDAFPGGPLELAAMFHGEA